MLLDAFTFCAILHYSGILIITSLARVTGKNFPCGLSSSRKESKLLLIFVVMFDSVEIKYNENASGYLSCNFSH